MEIFIPEWMLWTAGAFVVGPMLVIVCYYAFIGWIARSMFSGWG